MMPLRHSLVRAAAATVLAVSCFGVPSASIAQGIPVIDASALAQSIISVSYQTQQLIQQVTMVQQNLTNLMQLPSTLLNQAAAPYANQLAAFQQLHGSVSALMHATRNVDLLYGRARYEMDSLQMTPAQWTQAYLDLAEARGGVYKEQLDQDIHMLGDFAQRADALRSLSNQVGAVAGNVEGLQLLTQTSNVAASEIMQLRAVMQRQAVLDLGDRVERETINRLSLEISQNQYLAATQDADEQARDIDRLPDLSFWQ